MQFLVQNKLTRESKSDFELGSYLLIILHKKTHKICQFLDDGYMFKSVFLDIFKTFDTPWHKGLILRLKQNGIFSNLLAILYNFIKKKKWRVVLNDQYSSWIDFLERGHKWSVLRSLLSSIWSIHITYVTIFCVMQNFFRQYLFILNRLQQR